MQHPTLDEYRKAREGLTGGSLAGALVPTPLVPLDREPHEPELWLKPELNQRVHSFKIRGVLHAVASFPAERRALGLSTVSAGNTAQALAWCGRHFGVPSRSLMPEGAPQTKIDAVRALGGEPVLVPVDRLFDFLETRGWEREPYAFVHPWTSRDLRIGHGSLGLELIEELPQLRTLFIPVGGGGLLSGVAGAVKALRPKVRVVAVEPEGCPSLHTSLANGRPTRVSCDTFCDGVAVPYITDEMFPVLASLIDDCVLVAETDVKHCVRRLALRDKMVAEGSAALAVAAALAHPWTREGPAVALVTGGSIDADKLQAILAAPGDSG